MPKDDRQAGWRGAPLDFIKLGMTNATSRDAQTHLTAPRFRYGAFDQLQGFGVDTQIGQFLQQHRFHHPTHSRFLTLQLRNRRKQHVFYPFDKNKFHFSLHMLRQRRQLIVILMRQDHPFDAGPPRGKNFFLDAANRQN